ncbi:ATP-binding protein [Danxiaibacter flavus]|uniref:histidine kinase n=1 Tax=Danxiaibacter flavus TaxID=3049108 RepID=A0ABV3ZGI6_9BACT|nr:ATP-binding protein [Chitinophagaceae bacterium DXS]
MKSINLLQNIQTTAASRLAGRIRIGFITAITLLFISYLLTFYTSNQLIKQATTINQTKDILNNLEFVISYTKDGETAMRGYLAFDNAAFLEPLKNGHGRADSVLRVLRHIARDDESQEKIARLKKLVDRRYEFFSLAVNSFNENGHVVTPELRQKALDEKKFMDSAKAIISQMQLKGKNALKYPAEDMNSFSSAIRFVNITSFLLAALLALYSVIIYNRENKLKEEAKLRAMAYRDELEKRIEELNSANKELLELRSIEKFAATGRIARTMAHEVRNPLTNIGLASEQLRGEIDGNNEEIALLMGMIDRNVSRINQLITDLLNSTKFVQLQYTKVNVNNLVDDTLMLAKDRIDLKNIKLEKSYDPNLCDIKVDPEKMKIALLNIIVNAVEAMESSSGVLNIKTEKDGDKCLIRITDNGSGMDEETVSKLFEPYFTRKPNGTGLGLTSTQNIILNHNGKIAVMSAPGTGTSFTITLEA